MKLTTAATVAALVCSTSVGAAGDEGRGHPLVDLGRRIRGREGLRGSVHQGRRHLGRHRGRRRRQCAHRGDQPHGRRQSADRHAVQHRQAVRRAGRGQSAHRRRGGRQREQVARRSCPRRSSRRRRATARCSPCRSTSTARTGCSTTRRCWRRPAPPSRPTGPTCSRRSTRSRPPASFRWRSAA